MFGILKENILDRLEQTYINQNEKTFKKEFNTYMRVIKENKNLKEFYEVYDLFNQVNFDDEAVAKEFVEESIAHLKKFDKNDISKLQTLYPQTLMKLNENSIEAILDQLIFNENINIKDKVIFKVNLIKQLVNKNKEVSSYKDTFERLETNINENVLKLNEKQTEILTLFVENDNSKISEYYSNLINEATDLVDKTIIESQDITVAKRLLEAKIKLNGLKNTTPNIAEIEKIIELKDSLM